MRYSKIHKLDVTNGEGVGVALFVQGCPFHCKNCFNQETWDFNGGKEWNYDIQNQFLNLIDRPYITRISLLGGDPLAYQNLGSVKFLLHKIKKRFGDSKKIWLYTGYTFEEICKRKEFIEKHRLWSSEIKEIQLDLVLFSVMCDTDILVDGQYIDELKDISLKFRGSENQRIIDLKKSLEKGRAVLYME